MGCIKTAKLSVVFEYVEAFEQAEKRL